MPGGRPSKIDQVLRYRDRDGEQVPVTVFDVIVGHLRMGGYVETAAALAGIHKSSVYEWLRVGARAVARAATHGLDLTDPTLPLNDHERRCVEFSDAVEQATAEWEARAVSTLDQLGAGGRTITHTTVKSELREYQDDEAPNGVRREYVEVERIVRTETLAPSAQVLEWRLTRRFPGRYAISTDTEQVQIAGDDEAEVLAAELAAYLQGQADAEQPKAPAKRAPRKKATQ